MFLLSAAGYGLIATSVIGLHRNMPNTKLKIVMKAYLEANKLEGVQVRDVRRDGTFKFRMTLVLPYNITASEIQRHVEGMEQATSSHIRLMYGGGPTVDLEFGYSNFKRDMPYRRTRLEPLQIPLYSPFGTRILDFKDETNCHMLIGGATRMGKTALIRLIITLLLHTTEGNVVIKALDNKVTDLYMFRKIPQIEIGETQEDAENMLMEVLQEVANRKNVLRSYDDCVDVRELRTKHPHVNMPSMFVIIDEYGRYSDNETVQKAVEQLVETSGYLDVHVIISSQRPDAQTVLKARIKANLTTRICFTTTDEKNSIVVLDLPDAAKLGKIQGRAVLLDGFPEVVHVPYLSTAAATDMLRDYVKEVDPSDNDTGRSDHSIAQPFQSFEPQPIGADDLPKSKKRNPNRKSGSKKA